MDESATDCDVAALCPDSSRGAELKVSGKVDEELALRMIDLFQIR